MPTDEHPPLWRPNWSQDFLSVGHTVGRTHLPGTDHPLFGFLQRVLAQLKHQGVSAGLIFPKQDGRTFEPFFDYCDADGTFWVLRIGGDPGQVTYDHNWFVEEDLGDPDMTYYRIKPEAIQLALNSFLSALAGLRAKHPSGGEAAR